MTKTTNIKKATKAAATKKTAGLPKIRKGASIRFRAFRGGEGVGSYVGAQTHVNGAYHELKVDGQPYKVRAGQILAIDGVAV